MITLEMVKFDRTILIISDHARDSANNCRRQLKQDATVSYQILTESYDGQIVERCQAQFIEAILIESYFPDHRGLALLEALPAQLADRCPPMIVIDTNDAHLAKRALRAGAADYLVREELNADALHQALQVVCSTVTAPGPRDREQLLAVSSDLEVITGKDGYFHWVSPNFERVLGWSPAEMIAHPWTEFVHPDDIETSTAQAACIFTGTEVRGFENRYRHKDGSYRWLLWRSRLDRARQILYGTAIDITARKQAEAALKASEDKYRRLFNSIDEGFCIFELIYDDQGRAVDWRYLEANTAFERQTGWQQPVGKRVRELQPDLEESWFESFAQLVATREPIRFTDESAVMNRWFDVYAFPIGAAHEPKVALLFEDVSDRKRTEARLQNSEAQFRLLMTASSDIIFTMSADWLEMRYLVGKDFLTSTHQPNRTWLEGYILPEDQPEVLAAIQQAIETRSIFELEHRVIRQNGTIGWAFSRAVPRKTDLGEIVEWIGAVGDITDRKQAEMALQQTNESLRQKTHQLETVNAELQETIEEVRVTEEELRCQNVELELARRQVAAESHRYQDLFDFAPDGYVITDPNGTIQEANQAFAALVGANFDEPVQIPLKLYICEADRLAFQNLRYELCQQSQGQRLWTEDLHLRTAAGRSIPVAITGTTIQDAANQVTGFRWLIQDITDRKQAAAAIAADLEATRLLHELSTRLITLTDTQQLYEEILDTAIALSRADAGSFQCLNLDTNELQLLVTRGFSQTMIDHFERVVASSETSCGQALTSGERAFVDFNMPHDDPDGSLQMHLDAGLSSAQSTPLRSRSGRLIGMFSTHWRQPYRPSDRELRFLDLLARQAADLIEQRHADANRQQLLEREQAARAEAERANRVKDEFLAILSHELRSPLNPILGWSKLLQTQNLDAPKTERALETIERNAKLLTQLIDDLLDVARILRGKLQIAEQPVNLATVIEAAIEVVDTAAKAKSIAIHTDLAPDCLVTGDEARLQQVIWNLLSNAIKFTPDEGRIDIRLTAVDHRAQISVTDTGKGISPDFLPRLFDAFLQEDVSITRRYGGLGLGLSIVKYLVEAHGGTITADSPGEGLGATFTVYLPRLPVHSAVPADQSPSAEQLELAGTRVLAVDDRADARELLEMVLAQYGAEALIVDSGHEVLTALPNFQPQVLVCDIGMPDMDGYTLMQFIRHLPPDQGGDIPAIAVTAFAKNEDAQRALHHGYQAHIPKPIEPGKLVSAILELVKY